MANERRHLRKKRLRPGRSGRGRTSRLHCGHSAVFARAVRDHVPHASVDHPAVRRLFHRRGKQRVLPPQSCSRTKGPFRGLRSADAPRLRLGSPARRRRCRQGGRCHRLGAGHENPVRRYSSGQDIRVHDHERRGPAGAGVLHRHRRGAGCGAGPTQRHHPKRHSQRVHGAQHLHLPARRFDAHRRRHFPLHGRAHAQVQQHQHFRLPHAGSRRLRRSGNGVHPRRRPRIRAHGPERRHRHR